MHLTVARVASTLAVTAGSVMSCPLTLVTRSHGSAAVRPRPDLQRLRRHLSPIAADPALAEPLAGIPELLGELARRYQVVGVISGRPVAFLAARLRIAAPSGVLVEPKGLSGTCHYRANPALVPQVTALAREAAAATGLVARAGAGWWNFSRRSARTRIR